MPPVCPYRETQTPVQEKSNPGTGDKADPRREERRRVQGNPKSEETELEGFWGDADDSDAMVAQRDPHPSHSATLSYMEHLKIIPRIITRQRR